MKLCDICNTEFIPRTSAKRCSTKCRKEFARRAANLWYRDRKEEVKEVRNERSRLFRETQTLRSLYNGARERARSSGQEFSISFEDLKIPDVCPLLETPFIRKTPYAMSLDRIDSSRGYTTNNVWIISRKANLMKNDASEQELITFARNTQRYFGVSE